MQIYRRLAEDHPDVFLPRLAAALSNWSICLADSGCNDDALTTINQAVEIYRRLADSYPGAFQVTLATSLESAHSPCLHLGETPTLRTRAAKPGPSARDLESG